jgi:hypothetical protein
LAGRDVYVLGPSQTINALVLLATEHPYAEKTFCVGIYIRPARRWGYLAPIG